MLQGPLPALNHLVEPRKEHWRLAEQTLLRDAQTWGIEWPRLHENRRALRRCALGSWLEITSSSVSKAIRSLTTSDMGLLSINESPESGREKTVQLTAKGGEFVERMNASGVAYLQGLVDQLSDDEIAMVAHIFSRTNDIFESYPGPFRA